LATHSGWAAWLFEVLPLIATVPESGGVWRVLQRGLVW